MHQTIGIAQEIRRKNTSKRKPCAIDKSTRRRVMRRRKFSSVRFYKKHNVEMIIIYNYQCHKFMTCSSINALDSSTRLCGRGTSLPKPTECGVIQTKVRRKTTLVRQDLLLLLSSPLTPHSPIHNPCRCPRCCAIQMKSFLVALLIISCCKNFHAQEFPRYN